MVTLNRPTEQLTQEELKELAGISATPAISIFFPTKRTNVEPQENSLLLKDALSSVEGKLEQRRLKSNQIEEILRPLKDLLNNRDFWMHQSEGLAIFRTGDDTRLYSLPVRPERAAYVSEALVIRPLLGTASPLGEFHILALSQNKIRLLHCTRDRAEELDLAPLDIPLSLEEALRYDDLQKPALNFHPGTGPARAPAGSVGGGKGEQTFHGHGDAEPDQKNQILRFFQAVDPGIRKLLNGTHAPLLLAGVEYLRPLYLQASDYQHIAQEGIDGNADSLRVDELLTKAQPIFEKWLGSKIASFGERYGDFAAHGKGGSDLQDILQAAQEGRVDTLFIKEASELWGVFDPASLSLDTSGDQRPGDVELYDLAARLTIQTGGQAFLLSESKMIGGGRLAAIYRY